MVAYRQNEGYEKGCLVLVLHISCRLATFCRLKSYTSLLFVLLSHVVKQSRLVP